MSEKQNAVKKALYVWTPALIGAGASYLLEMLGENYMLRNILPEPIDIFDHIGNGLESSGIGLGVASAVIAFNSLRKKVISPSRQILATTALGLCVGAGANVAVETPLGAPLYGVMDRGEENPRQDPWDIPYGVAAATAVAYLTIRRSLEVTHANEQGDAPS
jgi:hypothetical protein